MINRKNIWFLTLFSLILALSVYYVTMPSEALLDVYGNVEKEDEVVVETTDVIAVHHLENETKGEAPNEYNRIFEGIPEDIIYCGFIYEKRSVHYIRGL